MQVSIFIPKERLTRRRSLMRKTIATLAVTAALFAAPAAAVAVTAALSAAPAAAAATGMSYHSGPDVPWYPA
jgi:hypothetical protein